MLMQQFAKENSIDKDLIQNHMHGGDVTPRRTIPGCERCGKSGYSSTFLRLLQPADRPHDGMGLRPKMQSYY